MQHKSKGIRIYDLDEREVVIPKLMDFLIEIPNGEMYNWSILYLYATGHLGPNIAIGDFENQINSSEKGLEISWKDLNLLAPKFHQVIDIILIGSKDKSVLHRYENDSEMYESCDFTIVMVDSGYWEIFSKNKAWIDQLKLKFKETEFLEPDFLK